MKVVINRCNGGFGLSPKAVKLYLKLKNEKVYFYKHDYKEKKFVYSKIFLKDIKDVCGPGWHITTKDLGPKVTKEQMSESKAYFSPYNIKRDDPVLIEVVERLKGKAGDIYADLEIVEIPDDVIWTIEEHAGAEWIAEEHETWYGD